MNFGSNVSATVSTFLDTGALGPGTEAPACPWGAHAPAATTTSPPSSQVARAKVVQIGMGSSREPNGGIALGSGGIGGLEHNFTFHAGLTAYDAQGALTPRVAAKVPSVADGDWQVAPDGTMQV